MRKMGYLILVLVTGTIASLPRNSQEWARPMTVMISTSAQTHAQDGLARIMQIRKFRRRRLIFEWKSHLQQSFIFEPSISRQWTLAPLRMLHVGRIPDPLIHPPA
jgi:hypothetical protein